MDSNASNRRLRNKLRLDTQISGGSFESLLILNAKMLRNSPTKDKTATWVFLGIDFGNIIQGASNTTDFWGTLLTQFGSSSQPSPLLNIITRGAAAVSAGPATFLISLYTTCPLLNKSNGVYI